MGRLQKIKCVVDNQVAVDIGANQVGDIATVALLEETDQLLGKNHLFKRSLLLIKVWMGDVYIYIYSCVWGGCIFFMWGLGLESRRVAVG